MGCPIIGCPIMGCITGAPGPPAGAWYNKNYIDEVDYLLFLTTKMCLLGETKTLTMPKPPGAAATGAPGAPGATPDCRDRGDTGRSAKAKGS